jgi:5,10-methylenetetrahydromethanopterin reductase
VKRVKLDYRPRANIPIFMAARGENAVKTCGEIADGMIVSNMCALDFVAGAVQSLNAAARAAGRAEMPGVVQYMPCFVNRNADEARRGAKRAVGEMLPAYWALGERLPAARKALLLGSHIAEAEFAGAVARLKSGEAAEVVLDDRYVSAFALAGTAEDCRVQAAAFAEIGVSELALTISGPSFAADMEYIGKVFARQSHS